MELTTLNCLLASHKKWLSRMRTISRGMCVILAMIFVPVTPANACKFVMQRSVAFEAGVSSLSNQDRVDLAKTVIDANNSVARTGTVVIYGLADADEAAKDVKKAKAIAEKRVESVITYLRSLGVSQDRFAVDYHAWRFALDTPPEERFQVLVEFIPASSPCG